MVGGKILIISRFLLGIFTLQIILPLILVISIFFVKQNQHRIIENWALHQHLFVTITIDEHEFSKLLIETTEFTYQGELYDIHSIKKKNGKFIIDAIKDDNEKKLKILNNEAVKKNSRNTVKLLKNCNSFFVYFENSNVLFHSLNLLKTNFILYKLKFKNAPYLKILSPPPDLWAIC